MLFAVWLIPDYLYGIFKNEKVLQAGQTRRETHTRKWDETHRKESNTLSQCQHIDAKVWVHYFRRLPDKCVESDPCDSYTVKILKSHLLSSYVLTHGLNNCSQKSIIFGNKVVYYKCSLSTRKVYQVWSSFSADYQEWCSPCEIGYLKLFLWVNQRHYTFLWHQIRWNWRGGTNHWWWEKWVGCVELLVAKTWPNLRLQIINIAEGVPLRSSWHVVKVIGRSDGGTT